MNDARITGIRNGDIFGRQREVDVDGGNGDIDEGERRAMTKLWRWGWPATAKHVDTNDGEDWDCEHAGDQNEEESNAF